MSIRVMTLVWDCFPASGSELLAMLALADWCDDNGGSLYPSMRAVGEKIRVSEKQARRIIHKFVEQGYLDVVGNAAGGAPGSTKQFRLNLQTKICWRDIDHIARHKSLSRSKAAALARGLACRHGGHLLHALPSGTLGVGFDWCLVIDGTASRLAICRPLAICQPVGPKACPAALAAMRHRLRRGQASGSSLAQQARNGRGRQGASAFGFAHFQPIGQKGIWHAINRARKIFSCRFLVPAFCTLCFFDGRRLARANTYIGGY